MRNQILTGTLAGALLLSLNTAALSETPANNPAAVTTTTNVSTPAAAPVQIQAQVTTQATAPVTPSAELAAKDYFQISNTETDNGGHSKRKYKGVSITLKNTQPFHLEILQGEVANGLNETTIAQAEQHARDTKKQAIGFLMRAASAAPGLGMMGATNYGTVYALARTQQAMNVASNVVSGATASTGDNLEISGQFVNKVQNVIVGPNQTFTFKTLLPVGTDPQLKLIFKNLETSRIFEF